jgi:hypothetical protein
MPVLLPSSLCCHFPAVMQRLEELVNELEPELYPPEYIAEEVRLSKQASSCHATRYSY